METLNHILGKSYADLTLVEKAEIAEMCTSEEEFMHLKQVFAAVDAMAEQTSKQEPLPQTKQKLDELFYQTYQSKGVLWYNTLWTALYPADKSWYQRPALQLAAVFVLLIALYPVWNNQRAFSEEKMMARLETPQETITAVSPEPGEAKPEKPEYKMDQLQEAPPVAADEAYTVSANSTANYDVAAPSPIQFSRTDAAAEHVSWNAMEKAISNHPDGIFLEDADSENGMYNREAVYSLDENLAVLDILTATY
jgi:hypothetical protein